MMMRFSSGYGWIFSGSSSDVRSIRKYCASCEMSGACFRIPSRLAFVKTSSISFCGGVACKSEISSLPAASASGEMMTRSGRHPTATYVFVSAAWRNSACTSIVIYPATAISSVPRAFFNCVVSNISYSKQDVNF